MPTVLRIDGLQVVIYSNDHRPAHVHVIGAGKEVLFYLNCPGGPPVLRSYYRFTLREVNRIEARLVPHLTKLCRTWKELHGDYETGIPTSE